MIREQNKLGKNLKEENGNSGSNAPSDFSGRTMNTAMLAASTIRNESFAGSSTGQPQNFNK